MNTPSIKPRKVQMIHGSGEAWYYVVPGGLEIYVADSKSRPSQQGFRITTRQIERAVEIIRKGFTK